MLIRTLRCEPSARMSRVPPTVERPSRHSVIRRFSSFWPWSLRKPRSDTPMSWERGMPRTTPIGSLAYVTTASGSIWRTPSGIVSSTRR